MRFYNAKASDITGMHIYAQLGHCHNKKPKPKLAPTAQIARYLHCIKPHHLLVEMEDGSTQRIRALDFKPYNPFLDSKVTTAAHLYSTDETRFVPDQCKANSTLSPTPLTDIACAHAAATAKYAIIPKIITPTTPPPRPKHMTDFIRMLTNEW